jgi:integrase/recombinase XerD
MEEKDLDEYLDTIELSGITLGHKKEVSRYLSRYLDYLDNRIDKPKSLAYFKQIKEEYSIATYKKEMYQILKYLKYLGINWAKTIELPSDPEYTPKRFTNEAIQQTISYFEDDSYFKQIQALILLGSSSGMRAEEMYQLNLDDIDLDNRIVHINHNPIRGQTTKTQRSRVSFFTEGTKQAFSEYLTYFNDNNRLDKLFSQTHITHLFKGALIRVKDLRKYFSQEWDRRGGPTSIKKILMGHSLKGDVDLMHYNCQSEDDIKKIYDKVMNGTPLISAC